MSILNSPFSQLGLVPHLETAATGLWHLVLIFLARHWLLAVANAGFTVLLGMGLLRLLPRFPHSFLTLRPTRTVPRRLTGVQAFLFQDLDLRLPRLLFVAALCKGAFYLMLGDRHRMIHTAKSWFGYGFQIPDVRALMGFIPSTPNSTLWRPTAAAEQVGLALGFLALFLLLRRAGQVASLLTWLETVDRVCPPVIADLRSEQPDARVHRALSRAAVALGFSPQARLPRLLLIEVMAATPLLVGLARPYILLAPSLLTMLSDAELDAMLRHELAHFRRRDHWWRWALLWVEDMGRLNPLSGWLSAQALNSEEDICDRWAISSSREATALAQAIMKSRTHSTDSSYTNFAQPAAILAPPTMPAGQATAVDRLLPQLLGHSRSSQNAMLERRLLRLLEIARTSSATRLFSSATPTAARFAASFPAPVQPQRFNHRDDQSKKHDQSKEVDQEEAVSSASLFCKGPVLPPALRAFAFLVWAFLLRAWTVLVAGLILIVIYTKFFLILNFG